MNVPLHYQISEYDCVPTTFANAVAYLFDRAAVPPMVVRHIYAYSLDTVSRGGRLGRAGTSEYAVQLLGNWLASYKTRKFSMRTEYLHGRDVHIRPDNPILTALDEGGLALCSLYVGHGEWHFVLGMRYDSDWFYVFDPYHRSVLRGLRDKARLLTPESDRDPNLAIHRAWLDRDGAGRFTFGEWERRECLLVWRV